VEIATPHGPARAEVHDAPGARAVMALGHGAGGGFGAADLVAARDAAVGAGVTVVTVEQPYKVAGRRVAPAEQLDAAWAVAVPAVLEARGLAALPLVFGGRSSGARVACRTSSAFDRVVGVLCLAFPEHPPGRPEKSRMAELEGVTVPVLVVQGERDPFGRPPAAPGREVVVVPGSHAISNKTLVKGAVGPWLARVLG
jgi:predicted alpha/beta-hydrolase family hydrolase